ncbi:hypothetical protein KQI63_10605 [bacterium]|nr:hypothetical protein [bacterium]
MSTIKYVFFLIVSFIWANLYMILLGGSLLFLFAFLLVSVSLAKANLTGYLILLKTVAIPFALLIVSLAGLSYSIRKLRSYGSLLPRILLALVGLIVSGGLFYLNFDRFLFDGLDASRLFYNEFLNMIARFKA